MLRKFLFENRESRTPFLKPPLTLPGERVREKLEDELMRLVLIITLPLCLFIILIYKTIFSAPLSHSLSFLVHAIVIMPFLLLALFYGRKTIRIIRTYRLGFTGEQIVGQELERGRNMGYSIFHDIYNEEKKFNVDHIAIGTAGIVVVETKAKSKPRNNPPEIIYNGKSLVFPDKSYTTSPLDQVEANARWIQELSHKLISEKKNAKCQFNKANPVPVVRVVVYPGWYVDYEEAQKNKAPIIVTNDVMLVDKVIKSLKQPFALTNEMIEELQNLFDCHLRKKNKTLIEY